MNKDSSSSGQSAAQQREGWESFYPIEALTTPAAARLVDFAEIKPGSSVLDVACGTGVVAVTAARRGARVHAMDLAPALVARGRENAEIAKVKVDFSEGNAEELRYPDAEFDVVVSQFGHIYAPRQDVAIGEMLRVLKPGGTIAFSTFPPDSYTGRLLALVAKYLQSPAGGASPVDWGEPATVRQRLGDRVDRIHFDRGEALAPSLSPEHSRTRAETTVMPVMMLVQLLGKENPRQLEQFRREFEDMISLFSRDNVVRLHFLMTRAMKHRALRG